MQIINKTKMTTMSEKNSINRVGFYITIDYIDEALYPTIVANPLQLQEWKALFSFDLEHELESIKLNETAHTTCLSDEDLALNLLKSHPTLLLNTELYDENSKKRILTPIDKLDEKINGYLIKSDNLEALKVLSQTYRAKIQCICIDPPYNTKNETFPYKDNYSPSEWNTLIWERLELAKTLLTPNGVMFINIDDNELITLLEIARKVFSKGAVELYIWDVREKGTWPKTATKTVRNDHEYIIAAYNGEKTLNKYSSLKYADKNWTNPDNDPRGPWISANLSRNSGKGSGGSKSYTITNPEGIKFTRDWRVTEEDFKELLKDNRIHFGKRGKGVPRLKIFQNEPVMSIQSSIFSDLSNSQTSAKELKHMFGKRLFQYPKPTELIQRLCVIGSNKGDIIMDFFAGSGTTGHAVLKLNKDQSSKRKFILIESEEFFDTLTLPRILKAIYSDSWEKDKPVGNTGTPRQIIQYQHIEDSHP